jgi:hypothetical protein
LSNESGNWTNIELLYDDFKLSKRIFHIW